MENKKLYIVRSIVALILGLVFIFWSDMAGKSMVMVIGAIFALSGMVYIVDYFKKKNKHEGGDGKESFLLIGGIGSVLFGTILIAMPTVFISTLMIILGVLLFIGGIMQIVSLSRARRWTNIPVGYFLAPSLIIVAGALLIVKPSFVANIAFIVLGASFVFYAISELVNGVKISK